MTRLNRAAPLLITLGAGLAGCVHFSTSGLREEQPVLSATSTKPTNEIVGCINTAWERSGTVSFIPNAHGGSISFGPPAVIGTPLLYLVDIDDQGSVRRVTLHMAKTLAKQVNRIRATVQACL